MCTVLLPPGVNPIAVKKIHQKPTLYYSRKYLANASCDTPFMAYINCYLFRSKHVVVDVCHVRVTECIWWMIICLWNGR